MRTAPCIPTKSLFVPLRKMLDPEQDVPPSQNLLSAAQRSAIEGIVAESVHNALDAFRSSTGAFTPSPVLQTPRTPVMASPLGLSRPVDRGLEDKILRGEYIDLALLLPDNMYQPQTPELHLRLDDSSLGPLGSPVTMVRKRKPVIDTFRSGICHLELELAAHPDRTFVSDLLSSLKERARIGYSSPRTSRVSPNLISAAQHPKVVSSNLQKEIALGRVAGPYPDAPLPDFQCHPVGVVPKRHSSEWRTIYHLSYPQGHNINDYIPKDSFSLTYVRVDDAIHILKTLGKGAFMAKTDLKSAFRLIPIHPEDWSLLGIYWQSQYYVDMHLPFGLRSAPFLFNQLSDGIELILKHNYGLKHVIYILDDFFIAEHSKLACLTSFSILLRVSCHLRPQL